MRVSVAAVLMLHLVATLTTAQETASNSPEDVVKSVNGIKTGFERSTSELKVELSNLSDRVKDTDKRFSELKDEIIKVESETNQIGDTLKNAMVEMEGTRRVELIDEVAKVVGTIIAFIMLGVAIYSLWRTKESIDRQITVAALSNFAIIEHRLVGNCNALGFHGISAHELSWLEAEYGISQRDLAYLLSIFTTAGMYFRTVSDKEDEQGIIFFKEKGYFQVMFDNPETRAGWLVLKKCIAPSDYWNKLEQLAEEKADVKGHVPVKVPDEPTERMRKLQKQQTSGIQRAETSGADATD